MIEGEVVEEKCHTVENFLMQNGFLWSGGGGEFHANGSL